MGRHFERIMRAGAMLALAGAAGAFAAAGQATAAPQRVSLHAGPASERATYVAVGATTRAPIGWVEFCEEYKPECNTKPTAPRDIVLSATAWSDLLKVNAW